jgi:hypothetical protein
MSKANSGRKPLPKSRKKIEIRLWVLPSLRDWLRQQSDGDLSKFIEGLAIKEGYRSSEPGGDK